MQAAPLTHGVHVPALQTLSVPQELPLGRLAKPWQSELPVAQEVFPCWQGLPGLRQARLSVQATQLPLLQTLSLPQLEPVEFATTLEHTGLPLAQSMRPLWHGLLLGLQVAPSAQITHWPARQTRSVPQERPFALVVVILQDCTPVEQSVLPTWQPPFATQTWPSEQATQLCVEVHTFPLPQTVPTGLGVRLPQTGLPLAQEIVPVEQLSGPKQENPAWQVLQAPLRHTWLDPHEVPLGLSWTLLHTAVPVAQSSVALWQTLPSLQLAPWLHPTQLPLLQTPPVQAVPLGELPMLVQTAVPLEQSTFPDWQDPAPAQGAPASQARQEPLKQLIPVPQVVPLGCVWKLVHFAVPVEQSIDPRLHGLAPKQGAPAEQPRQAPLLQTWPDPQATPSGSGPMPRHTGCPVLQETVPPRHGSAGSVHLSPPGQALQAPL